MSAFGDMGTFCGIEGPEWWDNQASCPQIPPQQTTPKSEQFQRFLGELSLEEHAPSLRALLGGTSLDELAKFLQTLLRDVHDSFSKVLDEFRSELAPVFAGYQAIHELPKDRQKATARALYKQIDTMLSQHVISFLAEHQFLPRYGFPVGVHRLKVFVPDEHRPYRIREDESIKLERSSLLALSEYAPGSRLLVGGKRIVSRGVLRHFASSAANDTLGLRGTYATCQQGHLSYSYGQGNQASCQVCDASLTGASEKWMLLPRYGFSSAAWDPPQRSTSAERVGSVEQATLSFAKTTSNSVEYSDFAGIPGLRALYREDGEIFIYNEGEYHLGFALCTSCGFAQSEIKVGQGQVGLPPGFERHAPLASTRRDKPCWGPGQAPVLRNHSLSARETTDIALIDISKIETADRSLACTLGYALQIAGARLLEVDSRELGVLPVPMREGWAIAIHDNVPGGVGHTRELLGVGSEWLLEARKVLRVDDAHDARCEPACFDCVLTFDSQHQVEEGTLDRRRALQFLDKLFS